jgi:hypothetical protein
MNKRILGSLCLAGVALVGGATVAPFGGAHAASNLVKMSNPGYSLMVPGTWKYDNKIPTNQLFKNPSLQRLTPTSAIFFTADNTDAVGVVVMNGTASTSAIKALESKIIRDDTKLQNSISYQTVSQHGASFLIAAARVTTGGKTVGEAVAAATHAGKTYYFLASVQIGGSAKLKADGNEVTAVLNSITIR